jgi:hypothetical protein
MGNSDTPLRQRGMRLRNIAGITVLFAFLAPVVLFGQQSPGKKAGASAAGAAAHENTYFHAWDAGEQKTCTTFSDESHLLICDDSDLEWGGAFIHLISRNPDLSEDERYHEAFVYALAHSKTFIVRFSKNPWPTETTQRRMALWDCSKSATAITCKFNVEERPKS